MHGSEEPAAPWRPLARLLDDPAPLDARVEFVRTVLCAGGQDVPTRVAASVVHLGVAARLLSPALAVAALGGTPLAAGPADIRWQDDLGGAFPLSVARGAPVPFARSAVGLLGALVIARYGTPAATVGGNVASAVNSAARLLAQSRPDLASAAQQTADRILAEPQIEGGLLHCGPDFRRRSCCLIYRASGTTAAVCGDCVLGARAD